MRIVRPIAVKSGDIGAYKWSESVPSGETALFDVVRNLRHHLNGLRAVNVSCDSGLLVPSDDENRQGWVIQDGHAISPVIDDGIIDSGPWCDGGYEEWYLFSTLPSQLKLAAFCNWGQSITDWASLVNVPTGPNLRQRLETARPHVVLGVGDMLFAISTDRTLMKDFEEAYGRV